MVSRSICQPTRFGVDEVVAQLRERRESSLRARQNGNSRPPLLPSRPVLAEVVNGLAAALFPHRLGRPDLCSENIDHYVGYTLDLALSALHQQVRRELLFRAVKHSRRRKTNGPWRWSVISARHCPRCAS